MTKEIIFTAKWICECEYKRTYVFCLQSFGGKLGFTAENINNIVKKKMNTAIFLMFSFSLFVLLKGATKEQAFNIGKDIVDTVTAMNPKPVKLKFEKV